MQADGREGKPGEFQKLLFFGKRRPLLDTIRRGFLLQSPSEAIFRTVKMAGMPDLGPSSLMPILGLQLSLRIFMKKFV